MKFKVIEGGLSKATDERAVVVPKQPSSEDVQREAVRRLRESGYHTSYVRQLATGAPQPSALRHLKMQLDFAAQMLSRLNPIPEDFDADAYWPSVERSR